MLDLHIILKTLIKVVKREDVTVIDQTQLRDLHVERVIMMQIKTMRHDDFYKEHINNSKASKSLICK